jgi:hypothetical protein
MVDYVLIIWPYHQFKKMLRPSMPDVTDVQYVADTETSGRA